MSVENQGYKKVNYKRGIKSNKEYISKSLGYQFLVPEGCMLLEESRLEQGSTPNDIGDMEAYMPSGARVAVRFIPLDGSIKEIDIDLLGNMFAKQMNAVRPNGRSVYYGAVNFVGKLCAHIVREEEQLGALYIYESYTYCTPYYEIIFMFSYAYENMRDFGVLMGAFDELQNDKIMGGTLFSKRAVNKGTKPLIYKRGKSTKKEYKSKCLCYKFRIPEGFSLCDKEKLEGRSTPKEIYDLWGFSSSGIEVLVQYLPMEKPGLHVISEAMIDHMGRETAKKMNATCPDGDKSTYYGVREFAGKKCAHSILEFKQNDELLYAEFYMYYATYYMLQFTIKYSYENKLGIEAVKECFSTL